MPDFDWRSYPISQFNQWISFLTNLLSEQSKCLVFKKSSKSIMAIVLVSLILLLCQFGHVVNLPCSRSSFFTRCPLKSHPKSLRFMWLVLLFLQWLQLLQITKGYIVSMVTKSTRPGSILSWQRVCEKYALAIIVVFSFLPWGHRSLITYRGLFPTEEIQWSMLLRTMSNPNPNTT